MKSRGKTFQFDLSGVGRLGDKMTKTLERDDKLIGKRITKATDMIWRIAHQKRPYITAAQAKKEGRSFRVSDPNAQAGVPVAINNGGKLQASVQQQIQRKGTMQYLGRIFTRGVTYAGFLEYGTSKMRARPFMRPAVALTKDVIKKMLGANVSSDL